MGLQGVTGGYMGLHGVTRGYRRLQEFTGGYRVFQAVTGDYNKKLGNYASLTKLISFNRISRNLVFIIKMKNVTNP